MAQMKIFEVEREIGIDGKPIWIHGDEKLTCMVCGSELEQLAVHIKAKHSIDVTQYKAQFPNSSTQTLKARWTQGQAQKNKAPSGQIVISETVDQGTTESSGVEADDGPKKLTATFGTISLDIRTDVEDGHAFVPNGDEEYQYNEEFLNELAVGIRSKDNVYIWGPTGCGKSSCVTQVAAILNQPIIRINMDGDVRSADFIGEKIVDIDAETKKQRVIWKDGVLPMSIRKGYWLLIDEIDASPASILFVLQSVLEGNALLLKENGGEVIPLHENFRIIATANTVGKGDGGVTYQGTNVLNEAFLDRFATNIRVGYLDQKAETVLLVAKTKIGKDMANKMVTVANEVRRAFDQEETMSTFSTRRLLNWAQKTLLFSKSHIDVNNKVVIDLLPNGKPDYNWKRGAKVSFLSRLLHDDRVFVEDIMQRVIGS